MSETAPRVDDAELVEAAQRGDRCAFETLLGSLYARGTVHDRPLLGPGGSQEQDRACGPVGVATPRGKTSVSPPSGIGVRERITVA
jgi:hypothetical protein